MKAAVFIAVVSMYSGSVLAAPLVFNTGVDASGAVVANGSAETHYAGTGGTPTVDAGISATPAADGESAWIYPNELGPGSYALETDFATDAAVPMTIMGRWAAMSQGFYINFNGNYFTDSTIADGDTSWHDFTVTGTTIDNTVSGLKNYLTFDIYHSAAGTPLGLRVEITSVSAVPEPGVGVMGLCFGGVSLFRRCRDEGV